MANDARNIADRASEPLMCVVAEAFPIEGGPPFEEYVFAACTCWLYGPGVDDPDRAATIVVEKLARVGWQVCELVSMDRLVGPQPEKTWPRIEQVLLDGFVCDVHRVPRERVRATSGSAPEPPAGRVLERFRAAARDGGSLFSLYSRRDRQYANGVTDGDNEFVPMWTNAADVRGWKARWCGYEIVELRVDHIVSVLNGARAAGMFLGLGLGGGTMCMFEPRNVMQAVLPVGVPHQSGRHDQMTPSPSETPAWHDEANRLRTTRGSGRAFVSLLQREAKAGDVHAMYWLGSLYANGFNDAGGTAVIAPDQRAAVRWFRRGATAGDPQSMAVLAGHLFDGRGVRRDRDAALQLELRAAKRGNVHGAAGAAASYTACGDHRAAFRWLLRAGAMGANVDLSLAKGHLFGLGTRRDVTAATAILKRVEISPRRTEEERTQARLLLAYLGMDPT